MTIDSIRPTEQPVLTAQDIAVGFSGRRVLEHVNLALPPQGLIAIVGASGVGKSTLLRGLAGLLPVLSGEVTRPAASRGDSRGWSMVFQAPRLLPWRRVRANVELGLEGLTLKRAERRLRAERYLELVGLDDYAERWPHSLSGGQQQRVGLARALAVEPDVLFMDEPFSALDAITRRRLQESLIQLRRQTQAAIVFVTHDIEEAVLLSDRIIVLGHEQTSPIARVVDQVEVSLPVTDRRREPTFRALTQRVEQLIRAAPHAAPTPEVFANDQTGSGISRPHR